MNVSLGLPCEGVQVNVSIVMDAAHLAKLTDVQREAVLLGISKVLGASRAPGTKIVRLARPSR